MSSLRLMVAAIWIAILFATHGIWTATAVPIDPLASGSDFSTTSVFVDEPADSAGSGAWEQYDLYGNEIEEALGDYRIDMRGDMYERHAPQTALPEPARPST